MGVNHITVDLTKAQYLVLARALDEADKHDDGHTRAALVRQNAREILDAAAKAHGWKD